jgi:ribosomal protein S18 acetylase RimI-like enzyme
MLKQDQTRFPPTSIALENGHVVILRFLSSEDADALGDFYGSLPRATYRFYCPHPLTHGNAARLAARASSPMLVALLAEDEAHEIVGYASYHWQHDDSRASTFGICLRQAYRGIGLGQAMVERLLEIAQHVGPPVMSLTAQKGNPRALALYRKTGFQVVREQMRGQVEEFPPEPEVYMERQVRT